MCETRPPGRFPDKTGGAGIWHLLQPSTPLGATPSAFPTSYSIRAHSASPEGISPVTPSFLRLCRRENQGAPHFSFSHCLLYHHLTPFVPPSMPPSFSAAFVSPSSRGSWPHALSLPPLCLCHLSSLPGLQPSRLPGCPPWLPLCGSELAPPPAPPRARPLIRLWTQRLGTRHKAPGAKDRPQPSAPTEEPPAEGMGVGRPTRYVLRAEVWAGVRG